MEIDDKTELMNYADACLRSFWYHIRALQKGEEEYRLLTLKLEAAVCKSPRIKSEDEAKYQNSPAFHTGGPNWKIMDLLDEREAAQDVVDEACAKLHEIGEFLRVLDEDDVELIGMRYERRLTYSEIGQEFGITVPAVKARLERALAKWSKKI